MIKFSGKFIHFIVHPGNVEKFVIFLVVVFSADYIVQPELLHPPGILLGNGSFEINQAGMVKLNGNGVFFFML
jgi:hypothetical protein